MCHDNNYIIIIIIQLNCFYTWNLLQIFHILNFMDFYLPPVMCSIFIIKLYHNNYNKIIIHSCSIYSPSCIMTTLVDLYCLLGKKLQNLYMYKNVLLKVMV